METEQQHKDFLASFDQYKLPEISYSYDSLEPYISSEALKFHHQVIHNIFVINVNHLNKYTKDMKDIPRDSSLKDIMIKSKAYSSMKPLYNTASQYINHSFFWQCMKPNGGGSIPSEVEARLNSDFGSVDQFKLDFINMGGSLFGSGWVWLIEHNNQLKLIKTMNADNPLADGMKPILTCDLWEHSYFLDYRNERVKYLTAFINHLVNWEFVASQLN